jgi:Uma2 family endonuclease
MSTIATQGRLTPEDLLRLEDEGLFELVDGKLVEKRMSSLASRTAGIITARLVSFAAQGKLYAVYPEQAFQCFPHAPDMIRRPDIAVVVADRVAGVPEEGHVPVAPDVAIEVVSPSDSVYELDEKLADYRAAGIKLVWVINPKARVVRVHRPDHSVSQLEEGDTLSGELVLPGFSARVSELLPSPAAGG